MAWLVSRAEYDPGLLLLIATAGNTLGALSTWLLGYLAALGYPVERFFKGANARAIEWLRRWGSAALLLSWLPLIGDGLCLAAGWLRLPFGPSLLAIVLGKLARYAVIVYAFA